MATSGRREMPWRCKQRCSDDRVRCGITSKRHRRREGLARAHGRNSSTQPATRSHVLAYSKDLIYRIAPLVDDDRRIGAGASLRGDGGGTSDAPPQSSNSRSKTKHHKNQPITERGAAST